jgi:hypothetical protein
MAGFPRPANMELFCRMCRTRKGLARRVSALCWAGAALFGSVSPHAEGFSSKAPDRFGQVPLLFEPAEANAVGGTVYLGHGTGYRLRVSPTRLDVVFPVAAETSDTGDERRSAARSAVALRQTTRLAFGMELVGGDAQAAVLAEQGLPTKVNYLVGNDPRAWRTGVTTHGRLRYQGVYPGIDVVYYGNQRQLEHDFVVAPGADPSQIRWRFEGTDRLELEPDGSLRVEVGPASLRFRPPQVYQWNRGEREAVPATYRLAADQNREVGFAVALYDPTRTLVIDPVLVYSSFLGGLGYEQASGAAVDRLGQLYVVGETSSTNFPIANALWPTNSGGYDGPQNPYGNEAFVAKLGAAGTNLIFATYLGGNGVDAAVAVTLDALDRPVITGLTGSTNFPITPNALQRQMASEEDLGFYLSDLFVAKLSASGETLLYSTYIGGEAEDQGLAIALDEADDIYVAGYTESEDFPVRNNATAFNDATDAFVLKFRPGETNLSYSMLLGGGDFDFAQSIKVDLLRHAYVLGNTASTTFPVTNAFQPTYRGGSYDVFLSKVAPEGNGLVFSTFLGGSGQEEGLGIALDPDGNAILTGYTSSSGFPVTNALDSVKASGRDVFVAKFNPLGQLLYSTFLGGRSEDEGWAIALDAAGSVFVAGMTQSSDFPTTNALQAVYQGSSDLFLTQLNPNGQSLAFSTFLGGPRTDEARALALDESGSVYVVGFTASTNFPVAPILNPVQRIYGGGVSDAIVLKILPSVVLKVSRAGASTVVLSWSAGLTGYVLESAPALGASLEWTAVGVEPVVLDGLQVVTVTDLSGQTYYRLRQPGP